MGCWPFKEKRLDGSKVQAHKDVKAEDDPNMRELAVLAQGNSKTNILDEVVDITQEIIHDDDIGKNSKLPGIVEDIARDELAQLLPSSPQGPQSNLAISLDGTDEDLENAMILQAAVRAFVMRKHKLKEENTPFAELMTSHQPINFDWEDSDVLIPQVPTFSRPQQAPQVPTLQLSHHFHRPNHNLKQSHHAADNLMSSQQQHSHQLQLQLQQQLQEQQQQQLVTHQTKMRPLLAQVLQRQSSKYSIHSYQTASPRGEGSITKPALAATLNRPADTLI